MSDIALLPSDVAAPVVILLGPIILETAVDFVARAASG